MKQIVDEKLCTGCTACMNICPNKAIIMEFNEDGFKYPVINKEKCTDCGTCKKVCSVLNTRGNKAINKCYVGYNKDEKSRLNKSSSGGIFELLAKKILDDKGIVIGATFDENKKLIHVMVDNVKNLEKLKGSKYLQSDLNDIFAIIKNKIYECKVLFVGTPCQVAGLKSFLKVDSPNLVCIDLICHGVPSPKLFGKYICELEKDNNDKVVDYNFRDKCTGWNRYSNTAILENKTITDLQSNNRYMKLFLSNIALRESCYECNFKIGNKYSDITLGDFWGIKKYYPEMYDNKGVSAIIINSEKGASVFEDIKEKIFYKDCRIEEIIDGNPSLEVSSTRNKQREQFFEDLSAMSTGELCKKYVKKKNIAKRVRNKIKSFLNKLKNS